MNVNVADIADMLCLKPKESAVFFTTEHVVGAAGSSDAAFLELVILYVWANLCAQVGHERMAEIAKRLDIATGATVGRADPTM